jgi:hypothetical protein
MPQFVLAIKSILQAEPIIAEEPPSTFEKIVAPIQQYLQDFANDKSQSELIFLLSVALAISLFAVILPLYEALFGSCAFEDDDGTMLENKQEETDSSSSSSGMRMYKPGVGVVEMSVEEIAELTMIRNGSIKGGNNDCDSSCRGSICSLGSCSLETIEESEEEYDSEDEE